MRFDKNWHHQLLSRSLSKACVEIFYKLYDLVQN
jgi:hypothetical protein